MINEGQQCGVETQTLASSLSGALLSKVSLHRCLSFRQIHLNEFSKQQNDPQAYTHLFCR